MSEKCRKIVAVVGILLGIAIVVVGFSLQDTSSYSIGEDIKFGADFYTEMYDVTRDVGRAISSSINDLIRAVSWLIISLGAITVCFFTYQLFKSPKSCERNFDPPKAPLNFAPISEAAPKADSEHERNFDPSKAPLNFAPISEAAPKADSEHRWLCDGCGKMRSKSPCEYCGKE